MTPGLAGFIASGHDELAWDQSVAGVLEALGRAGSTSSPSAAAAAAAARTWLDTFDWRLYRAGLTLEYVRRPRGGELAAFRRPTGPAGVTQPVTGWRAARPHLMCDLPDGPVASRIGDLVAPRALLPVVTVTSRDHRPGC